MTLTDAQIERYSRQIIVPHVGGRGQERLFAASVRLIGDERDIEAPHAYLVGAGVGKISVREEEFRNASDLALMLIGSEAARRAAEEIANNRSARALVIARLDAPGRIAIVPDAQSGVDTSVLAEVGERSEAADFIAMLATAEAFKLLAGYAGNPPRAIIEFDGFASRVRVNP